MFVILKETKSGLGSMGEEVKVADGYARNYLIPRNIAVEATEGNKIAFQNELKQKQRKLEKMRKGAETLKAQIEGISLTFERKVGEGEKLFGSVTSQEIADQLKEKGVEIDKKKIELDHPIKSLGELTVKVRLHHAVTADISLSVVAEASAEEEEVVEEAPAEEASQEEAPQEETPAEA